MIPGEIIPASGDIEINVGAKRVTIEVANTGDRPIQVGSHYHFFETNEALHFDRAKGRGQRLDIPSGTAVRFEPGQRREVTLVPLALSTVLEDEAGVFDFQVSRRDAHTLVVRLAADGSDGADELRRCRSALKAFAARQGVLPMRVVGETGCALQHGRSGKLKRVIAQPAS